MSSPDDRPASLPVEHSDSAFVSGRVIAVRTDQVQMPAGNTATRDVVEHPGAVGIIALDEQDRVLLVRQYRHPVRHELWEPPAGLLDVSGEPPLEAARRELAEEAHHTALTWHTLIDAFTSPGMSNEAIRIYLARDLSPVAEGERYHGEDEEHEMPVEWFALDDVVAAALSGRLHNPMGIMGALAAWRSRARGWGDLRPADAPWPARLAIPGAGDA